MADEVAIGSSAARAKIRVPVGVWLLSFVTLGIYGYFWWYFINRELRDLGRAKGAPGLGDNPGLSCAAFVLGFLTIYISTIWTIVTTTQRIQRGQRAVGIQDPMSGWIAGLLWVFTLGIGGIIYTQAQLNRIWRTQPQLSHAAVASMPAAPTQSGDADLDRLKKLAELKEGGAISPEEYEAEKAKLLPQQQPPSGAPIDAPPPPPGAAPLDTTPPPPEQR